MEPSQLFLSYSRKQFYIAEHLAQILNDKGLTTWFDAQKIRPGSDWQGSIDDGLATCQALVVLASRAAYRSGPVRYEVDAALKASKPIYLVVIEESPFGTSLLGTAKVIDCRSDFATGVRDLVTALKTGQQPAKLSPRRSLLSPRMPFGKVKYLQLLALNLAFLFGTVDLVLRKQVTITGAFTPRLAPALALASIPLLMWALSFAYSVSLLTGFRRQRQVTYFALELWPVVMIYAFPALLGVLDTLQTWPPGLPIDAGFGAYFNAHLAVTDRAAGPTLLWQILAFLLAYGLYLVFVSLTLRGWLLLAGWLPFLFILNAGSIPPPIRLAALLLITASIAFVCARRFLSGRDIPVAFGQRQARFDWSYIAPIVSEASKSWAMWLSPGAFPQDLAARDQARPSLAPPGETKTWRVHHVPADVRCARAVRKALAAQPGLRELAEEGADFQIALVSNKTPRRWITSLSARFPRLICIMVSSVDVGSLGLSLQQLQWIDYRQQQLGQLRYLARALAGVDEMGNPTVPENFSRPLGPYPVGMLTLALRMGSVACLTLAATGYLIVSQLHAMIAPLPLIGVSVVVGLWTWWEAGRLVARNAYLSETLLTFGALVALLVVWVQVAGVALLPRETWVHNGSYNGVLTSGVAFAGAFVLVPIGGFLLVASIELLRKVAVLHGWLPMATRPRWQHTLAVPFWRQLKLGVVTYLAVGLAMVAILTLTSPYQHPQVREFDLPDSKVSPESLAVGPDGNVWFALWGESSYQVGSVSSGGQLTPQRFAVPEPPKCVYSCTTGADLQLGPDHNFWYITSETFAPHKTELRRTTPDGVTSVFTLPSGGVNTSFAFDGAGTVWCTANSARTLTDLSGFISKIGASGHVTTYPMPSGILPVAILVTSDGTVWFFDAGTYALGTISATGKVTEYSIPSLPSDVLLASEQLIETRDHTLWFADPHGGIIGHITAAHTISLAPLPAGSVPRHLVADAAGGLWFLDTKRAAVGHLSASGQLTSYPFDSLLGPQSSLTVGPDGSVWFTLENQVGQIPPGGRMKLYDIPTLDAGLGSIIVGADGHVWFAEDAGLIGELTP